MPNIPTYQRTQIPSGETTAVKIPTSLAQTGQEALWQGLGQFGGALQRVGDTLAAMQIWEARIQGDREFIQGRSLLDNFDNDTLLNLAQTKVPEGETPETFYNNIINERLKARGQLIEGVATSQYAVDKLNEYAQRKGAEFLINAKKQAYLNTKDYTSAVTYTAIQDAIKRGDKTSAEEYIKEGMKNGFIGEEEGVKLLDGLDRSMQLEEGSVLAITNSQEFLDKIKDPNYLPELTPFQRITLYNTARGNLYETYNKTEKEGELLLAKGELDYEWLINNKDNLDPPAFRHFNEYLMQKENVGESVLPIWELSGKINDKIIDLKRGREVDIPEVSLMLDQLAMMGKEGYAQAKSFRDKFSTALTSAGKTEQSPEMDRAIDMLKRLRNEYMFTPNPFSEEIKPEDIKANELQYQKLVNRLTNWYESQPETPTDEEILEKVDRLTKLYRLDSITNLRKSLKRRAILGGIFLPYGIYNVIKYSTTDPAELVVNELEKEGYFDDYTPEERMRIKNSLRGGKTIQQAFDEVNFGE